MSPPKDAIAALDARMSARAARLGIADAPGTSPGDLTRSEIFWKEHQKWLEESGYMLRPRYKPDWVPSWKGTSKWWEDCEDGQAAPLGYLLDATRITDGSTVMLKSLQTTPDVYEAEIGQYLSSSSLASEPRNHSVTVHEVLKVPEEERIVIVMAYLRKYDNPPFDTIGEVVDFFRQVFEGIHFLHEHNIAHRDCNGSNIMMDARQMYPKSHHPARVEKTRDFTGKAKHLTRTEKPPKYYFVDFGNSRQYKPEERPPSEYIILGGDKSPPEHTDPTGRCDPFPTDVYYLGNMVRRDFMEKKTGFDFMAPLVKDMIADDPAARPTAEQVVARFETIRQSLGPWKLRSRVAARKEFFVAGVFRSISHWGRQAEYMVRRVPPLPSAT